jgi:pilus assembly protein Flp/PilA
VVTLVGGFVALLRDQEDEEGQTLVEYGLLLAFIAIVVIAALILIGPAVSGIFQKVNDQI